MWTHKKTHAHNWANCFFALWCGWRPTGLLKMKSLSLWQSGCQVMFFPFVYMCVTHTRTHLAHTAVCHFSNWNLWPSQCLFCQWWPCLCVWWRVISASANQCLWYTRTQNQMSMDQTFSQTELWWLTNGWTFSEISVAKASSSLNHSCHSSQLRL